jgi:hypothetical protein
MNIVSILGLRHMIVYKSVTRVVRGPSNTDHTTQIPARIDTKGLECSSCHSLVLRPVLSCNRARPVLFHMSAEALYEALVNLNHILKQPFQMQHSHSSKWREGKSCTSKGNTLERVQQPRGDLEARAPIGRRQRYLPDKLMTRRTPPTSFRVRFNVASASRV